MKSKKEWFERISIKWYAKSIRLRISMEFRIGHYSETLKFNMEVLNTCNGKQFIYDKLSEKERIYRNKANLLELIKLNSIDTEVL